MCMNSIEISGNCVIVHNCLLILLSGCLSLIRSHVDVATSSARYSECYVYQFETRLKHSQLIVSKPTSHPRETLNMVDMACKKREYKWTTSIC